jgi:hypothetical protein
MPRLRKDGTPYGARLDWVLILAQAAIIAASYTTTVTLRQLHYRLVAAAIGGYENTETRYKALSSRTSEARRNGTFPALSDTTRGITRPRTFGSPAEAIEWVRDIYRRDRTEEQIFQIWVLYEKATLTAQVRAWTVDYGIPIAALRGYSSESLEREIWEAMAEDGRPAVVFYLGDLDPEGEDIERNFRGQAARLGVTFKHWERLAVLPRQVPPKSQQYPDGLGLQVNPGKSTSSRAPGFVRKYGRLFQIEVEAIDPGVLETLVTDAITDTRWFDQALMDDSTDQEADDIETLTDIADEMG